MTQQFQELMFVDFGEELKMKNLDEFSVIPQDIQMSNALISQYEFCWFKEEKGYKRASTYLVSLVNGSTARIFSIMECKDKMDEIQTLKKELTDFKNKNIRTFIVGRNIVAENEVEVIRKKTEGEENAKNNPIENTEETVITPGIVEDFNTETIDTIPIGKLE